MALCGGSARCHQGDSIQVSVEKFGSGAVYVCRAWLKGRAGVTCVQMGWQKKIWSTKTQDPGFFSSFPSAFLQLEIVWFN